LGNLGTAKAAEKSQKLVAKDGQQMQVWIGEVTSA
jgi:hypothetical protein